MKVLEEQEVSFSCPHRAFEGLQRDVAEQVLQAVKFTDKNAPGLSLALDEEFQAADCFSELARGYAQGVVDPYTMVGLQPTGPIRVNLEVIVPSATGLTPERWKQTATLCPLDWPSNYSLLRLWHTPKSFHQYAAQLKQQVQHQHMFTQWEVNRAKLASRALFQRPAYYVPEQTLQQHVRERVFPDRKLRKRAPDLDIAAFEATCNDVRRLAAISEAEKPFAIGNSWNDTLRADKRHYLEYTQRSQIYNPLLLSPYPLGRTLRFTSLPSGLLVLRLAPVFTRLGPFCSGLDLCEAPLFRSVQI